MNSNSPIGIFDSGLGGLTVLKAMRELMPHENIIFFGDAARAPYGSRKPGEIKQYLQEFAEYFQKRKVKMAICACNTMTSHGYEFMKRWEEYSMIPMNPAIIPAVHASPNKRIGVIATEATINKGMHKRAAGVIDPGIQVFGVPCPKFVPLIESGAIHGEELKQAIAEYICRFQGSGIHALILGCTHYPIISSELEAQLPKDIKLINPAMETAKHAEEVLIRNNLRHTKPEKGTLEIVFSGIGENTKAMAEMILEEKVPKIKIVNLADKSSWEEEE